MIPGTKVYIFWDNRNPEATKVKQYANEQPNSGAAIQHDSYYDPYTKPEVS